MRFPLTKRLVVLGYQKEAVWAEMEVRNSKNFCTLRLHFHKSENWLGGSESRTLPRSLSEESNWLQRMRAGAQQGDLRRDRASWGLERKRRKWGERRGQEGREAIMSGHKRRSRKTLQLGVWDSHYPTAGGRGRVEGRRGEFLRLEARILKTEITLLTSF